MLFFPRSTWFRFSIERNFWWDPQMTLVAVFGCPHWKKPAILARNMDRRTQVLSSRMNKSRMGCWSSWGGPTSSSRFAASALSPARLRDWGGRGPPFFGSAGCLIAREDPGCENRLWWAMLCCSPKRSEGRSRVLARPHWPKPAWVHGARGAGGSVFEL